MHELSIARSVLDTVLEVAAENGGGRVRKVGVRIGELRQVVKSTLVEAFALWAQGTAADGAVLEIEWVPTVWRCSACARTRPLDDGQGRCPCGSTEARDRLVGSDDLAVTSLDLDEG